MYVGEYRGFELTLSDKEYQLLKQRLSVSRALLGPDATYLITEPCICGSYITNLKSCEGCPFVSGARRDCDDYIKLFDPRHVVTWYTDSLWWDRENDKEARQIIKKMRRVLLTMEYIKGKEVKSGRAVERDRATSNESS